MDSNPSILDRVFETLNTGAQGYFDLFIAKTQAEASTQAAAAEQERANTVNTLSRNGEAGGVSLPTSLPSWVIPVAVLGIGGIVLVKGIK